jgi:plasmid stability protein
LADTAREVSTRHDAGPVFEAVARFLTGVERSGRLIGIAERQIVRGGILVEEGPQQHARAVQRTQELTANPAIRAIFERHSPSTAF